MLCKLNIKIENEAVLSEEVVFECEVEGVEKKPSNFTSNFFLSCIFKGEFYGVNFENSKIDANCNFDGVTYMELCNFSNIEIDQNLKLSLMNRFPNNNWG